MPYSHMKLDASTHNSQSLKIFLFIVAHIPLALLMSKIPAIATFHAWGTLIIGLWFIIEGQMDQAIYVGAYITGAEVLWRMSHAHVFWEYGKYATSVLFIIAILRMGGLKQRGLIVWYFLLLLPSVLFTLQGLNLHQARMQISFNLSGPFSLMACSLFFSYFDFSMEQLQHLFLTIIGPICGIASLSAYSTLKTSAIYFADQSNAVTSGGFGPNQVSAMLGLGVLLMFLVYFINDKKDLIVKLLIIAMMIILAVQCALTFSRGGLYLAAASMLAASFFLIRHLRRGVHLLGLAILLFMAANYIILPRLDSFTKGNLAIRFQDRNLTGRDRIVRADLETWQTHPFLGVGPGMAKAYRSRYISHGVAAHTEFTRLLAEHGSMGLLALLLLLMAAWKNYQRMDKAQNKAIVVSMVVWSLLFMLINAMRIVAPSFLFGLCFATFVTIHSPLSKLGER